MPRLARLVSNAAITMTSFIVLLALAFDFLVDAHVDTGKSEDRRRDRLGQPCGVRRRSLQIVSRGAVAERARLTGLEMLTSIGERVGGGRFVILDTILHFG